MWSSRFVPIVAGVAVACASLAGCAAKPSDKGSDDVGSTESDLSLSGVRYLGKIDNGETRTGYYYNPPRYRSFAFDAQAGDQVTVDVSSAEGDAVGFITDSSFEVLAYNDDASSSTLDSHVTYTVPAGTAATSYRIVFRDYSLQDATFTVTLSIQSDPDDTSCAYDGNTYSPGDKFPSTDGCNTCSCGSTGRVSCTRQSCSCDPSNEPWRTYMGTPQQCMTLRYTCSSGQVPFQNACGCGCEQS